MIMRKWGDFSPDLLPQTVSSVLQQDAHSVSYGPIYSKIEDKVEYALGRPVSQDRAVATRIHGTVNI